MHRLLRWGSSVVTELAAADAALAGEQLPADIGQEGPVDAAQPLLSPTAGHDHPAANRDEVARPAARAASRRASFCPSNIE